MLLSSFLIHFISFDLIHLSLGDAHVRIEPVYDGMYVECNVTYPCNDAVIYVGGSYCYWQCLDGQCQNLSIYFSRNCLYVEASACAGSICSSADIPDMTLYNLDVYFSGNFMVLEYLAVKCTDCNVYIGSVLNHIDSSLFLAEYPDLNVTDLFDPGPYGIGSKLYVESREDGTWHNFNIYCIGSVSWCVTHSDNGAPNAYLDTVMYCQINEVTEKLSIAYPSTIVESEVIETEVATISQDWLDYAGCHFDCYRTDGCTVE